MHFTAQFHSCACGLSTFLTYINGVSFADKFVFQISQCLLANCLTLHKLFKSRANSFFENDSYSAKCIEDNRTGRNIVFPTMMCSMQSVNWEAFHKVLKLVHSRLSQWLWQYSFNFLPILDSLENASWWMHDSMNTSLMDCRKYRLQSVKCSKNVASWWKQVCHFRIICLHCQNSVWDASWNWKKWLQNDDTV